MLCIWPKIAEKCPVGAKQIGICTEYNSVKRENQEFVTSQGPQTYVSLP